MMKSDLLSKSKRDLRDYEMLIEKGYVLDVRGQWIPLNEKVKKERSFVKHLEAGEVLISGKWITISGALKLQTDKKETITLPSQDTFASEETVQMSARSNYEDIGLTEITHDETQTSFDPETVDMEQDFPAETIMISADEIIKNNSTMNQSIDEATKKKSFFSNQNLNFEESEISQETIAIPLNSIPDISELMHKQDEDSRIADTWERSRDNRKKIIFKVIIAVAILSVLALFAIKVLPALL